jgi:hypothetical protein
MNERQHGNEPTAGVPNPAARIERVAGASRQNQSSSRRHHRRHSRSPLAKLLRGMRGSRVRKQILVAIAVTVVALVTTVALTRMALKPPPTPQQVDELFQ